MIQNCYCSLRIKNVEKPSTVRDYLKIYFSSPKFEIQCQPIRTIDAYRDNDDVIIDFTVDAECEYIPGWKGSYWEPAEPEAIMDLLTVEDFIDVVDYALFKKFEEEYKIEVEDFSIPTEEDILDELHELEDYDEEF